jgi:hypothetical protein
MLSEKTASSSTNTGIVTESVSSLQYDLAAAKAAHKSENSSVMKLRYRLISVSIPMAEDATSTQTDVVGRQATSHDPVTSRR